MKQVKVLTKLAKELNQEGINWSLGASLMLYLYGYDVTVDDIDIIVDAKDHQKLEDYLKKYVYTYIESNPKYQTKHFYSLEIDGVDIDIMLDFIVKLKRGNYQYPFHIEKTIEIDGVNINLASEKEWLRAYVAMGRTEKVEIIKAKLM